ncbi:claudin-9-like [Corythoichthys intestinalis]|uniref:claudin-9-like n=1 Tax=Corythoichthys intestinalis TaxID=161448 RepID=UPI0025A5787A|nr:claudin-9-like [Corythoichthys intestinalis]XP_057676580.1 claudin-9-like [Corythoichthys intestinalis]XP_061801567.1 claudin-9-like [Nerophis lumbriciformis]
MASAALELAGFFLGLLGLLGSLVSTVLPYWENTAHVGSNIVTASGTVKGLWMECVHQSTGAFQCETFNSILALSTDLQASRALMVVSLVLSTLGLIIAVLGMQCTVCLEESGELKKRVAGAGGCFLLTAGFMTLVPVSWTTNKVIQNFYNPNMPATLKFELGDCLYLGIVSAFLSILGGGMLAASFCEGQEGGGGRGRRHGGGYPYPVGGLPAVRNPNTLQMGGMNVNSRGQTMGPSVNGTPGADHVKPVAAGYDVTGYV